MDKCFLLLCMFAFVADNQFMDMYDYILIIVFLPLGYVFGHLFMEYFSGLLEGLGILKGDGKKSTKNC